MPTTNSTSTMALKPVSCYTKTEGWVDASSKTITNLTGTKWYFNTTPTLPYSTSTLNYLINFTSNATNWTQFGTSSSYNAIYYSSTMVYSGNTAGWYNTAYRTIEITGGSDATNSTLITWLKQNAQLWSTTLKPVRYFIKKTGSGVTDLTGTTWYFNETLTNMPSSVTFYIIDYTTNGDSSSNLILTPAQLKYNLLNSGSEEDNGYIFTNGTDLPCDWGKYNGMVRTFTSISAYRTITFTGGTEATNTDLITWLQANATLISGGQTGTYLQPVVLLQKVEEEVAEAPTLISFTISTGGQPTTYQAEEGMTWSEWVNSEYNTDNIVVDVSHIARYFYQSWWTLYTYNSYSNLIAPSDTIQTNGEYWWVAPGSGN